MRDSTFTSQDWQLILESLRYTKLKFEEYDRYPSNEFKQKRIEDVNQVIVKIKSFIKMEP